MSSLSGVGLLTSFGDRRDLVPVALRAAAGPGLCLLCCGRRADRRSGQAARRTTPQSCLRARLLDHVRNPGGERDNHRSTAPFLSPGGESGRRGHCPAARSVYDGAGKALLAATGVPPASECQRRATRCRVHHRGRVRLWLDAVYRAGARRDPDHQHRRRDGAAGRHTPGFVFARAACRSSPQPYSPTV